MVKSISALDYTERPFIVQDHITEQFLVVTTYTNGRGNTNFTLYAADDKLDAYRFMDYKLGKITYNEYIGVDEPRPTYKKPFKCSKCGTALFFYETQDDMLTLCPTCDPHLSVVDDNGQRIKPEVMYK